VAQTDDREAQIDAKDDDVEAHGTIDRPGVDAPSVDRTDDDGDDVEAHSLIDAPSIDAPAVD
jgi:hypothetical protein